MSGRIVPDAAKFVAVVIVVGIKLVVVSIVEPSVVNVSVVGIEVVIVVENSAFVFVFVSVCVFVFVEVSMLVEDDASGLVADAVPALPPLVEAIVAVPAAVVVRALLLSLSVFVIEFEVSDAE